MREFSCFSLSRRISARVDNTMMNKLNIHKVTSRVVADKSSFAIKVKEKKDCQGNMGVMGEFFRLCSFVLNLDSYFVHHSRL